MNLPNQEIRVLEERGDFYCSKLSLETYDLGSFSNHIDKIKSLNKFVKMMFKNYSTVTLLAKFLGLSTSNPFCKLA